MTLIQWPDNDHTCVGETQSRYDIMVCYDLEAILARVKISTYVCTLHCHCTVMCAAVQCSVRSLYSMSGVSVSQLWPEHRMESTGSENCAVTE